MLTTLALAAVLSAPAAPVPAQPPAPNTAPVGPPPRVLDLRPDPDGKVRVTVRRVNAAAPVPGAPLGAPQGGPAPAIARVNTSQRVELSELADLKVTTVGGKAVSKDDALKALVNGGAVVVPADGKQVPAGYLKMFKDEVLVLSSPDLAGMPVGGGAAAGGGVIFQFQGGGLQLQPAAPGGLPPLQPNPAPQPKPQNAPQP